MVRYVALAIAALITLSATVVAACTTNSTLYIV